MPASEDFASLQSSSSGLTQEESHRRLQRFSADIPRPGMQAGPWPLLLRQFSSPITLLLLAAALLSYGLRDKTDP